jgi:hypothetical protein
MKTPKAKKQKETPILFHGDPLPKNWTAEKAYKQLARMHGKVLSGKEGAELV